MSLLISMEHGLRRDSLACREPLKNWHEPERPTKPQMVAPPVRKEFLDRAAGAIAFGPMLLPDVEWMRL